MAPNAKQNLEKVLKRFRLQDLSDIAIHEFPEITWEEIQNQIARDKIMKISKKTVIKVFLNEVKEFSDEEIDKRTSKLLLYYIGQTDTMKWNAFRLKNKIDHFNEKTPKLDSIKSAIRRTGLLAEIDVLKFNGKLIISVRKKMIRKRGGVVKSPPIFIQYFPLQPYIFVSKLVFDANLITAITHGLGYNIIEICHLDGPIVHDLLRILRNKEGGVISAELLEIEPDLDPEYTIDDNITNYSQHAKRAKYAEQIYGKDPPILQQLTVTVKTDKWNTGKDAMKRMEGTSLEGMQMVIKSPNVIELLKKMIADGMVIAPYPPYIEQLLSTGKNKIKIKE